MCGFVNTPGYFKLEISFVWNWASINQCLDKGVFCFPFPGLCGAIWCHGYQMPCLLLFSLSSYTLANFSIPTVGALFDEVVYTDIYGNAAEKIVRQYKDDAMGLPSFPAKRPRYDGGGRGGGGGGGRYGGPPPRDYGGPPPHFR